VRGRTIYYRVEDPDLDPDSMNSWIRINDPDAEVKKIKKNTCCKKF
jgi:hypothetical protein